jgi:hypothetical protein
MKKRCLSQNLVARSVTTPLLRWGRMPGHVKDETGVCNFDHGLAFSR